MKTSIGSRPARLRLAAFLGAALGAAPALGATPVAIYPVQAPDLQPDERQDVEALLEVGLRAAAVRGVLEPRQPPLLTPSCGPAPADACLAGLARGGVVLAAKAKRRGDFMVVILAFVDGAGRRTKPGAFAADLTIQSARPVDQALYLLEFELERLAGPTPANPLAPATPADPPAPRPAVSLTAPAPSGAGPLVPPTPAAHVDRPAARPGRPGAWMEPTGKWTAAGGLVLLAGATVTGLLGKKITSDLNQKYAARALTTADASSYGRAHTYGVLTTALLAGGGLATVTGLSLWMAAPDEVEQGRLAPSIGVSGRF